MGIDLKEALKNAPLVEITAGLGMICQIIDQVATRTGVVITPENIGDYIASRKAVRMSNNAEMGITSQESSS